MGAGYRTDQGSSGGVGIQTGSLSEHIAGIVVISLDPHCLDVGGSGGPTAVELPAEFRYVVRTAKLP